VRKREREGSGSVGVARSRAHPAPADPLSPRPVIRGGKSHTGKTGPRGGKSV
jgi:hypothetical protein